MIAYVCTIKDVTFNVIYVQHLRVTLVGLHIIFIFVRSSESISQHALCIAPEVHCSRWVILPGSSVSGKLNAAVYCLYQHNALWSPSCTKGRFPLPEFTARVDGCQKIHPSSRAVNSARELGPWTRVVETDLKGPKSLRDRPTIHCWSQSFKSWGQFPRCAAAMSSFSSILSLLWAFGPYNCYNNA